MIHNILSVIKAADKKPWLLLGKGPSFSLLTKQEASGYNIFALNHVCRFLKPKIAHFMDWKALKDCLQHVIMADPGAPIVCLPWYPHIDFKPTDKTLQELAQDKAVYSLLLFNCMASYNSSVACKMPKHPNLPTIRVRYFSAVAGFNILAAAGIRKIHTLGIDGGKHYAQEFNEEDKLANGRKSFDIQFTEIDKTCREKKVERIDLAPSLGSG